MDYVIIGGGIAGLYANYRLSKQKLNGTLLERENYFGGRVFELNWHNSVIKLGAGIMADHNEHLLGLLKELKIKPNYFNSDVRTFFNDNFNMNQGIKDIKRKYRENKDNIKGLTMKQFLIKYFGKKFTDQFITNCEYRDFLESDPGYFIKYYKIDDMSHDPYKILIIRWGELVEKLVLPNCKSNSEVISVKKIGSQYQVKTKNETFITTKVYFALTLEPLEKLTKNLINFKYSDYIGTIEFVRIYTYHSKPYKIDNMGHYNLVPGMLQKIIKISPNILMISYADNTEAKYWKSIAKKDKKIQIKKVEDEIVKLNKQVGDINITKIDDIEIGHWNEGVHYYKPVIDTTLNKLINKLSKPTKNIFVIGEIISKKHGWVEGAVESVNRVLKL